MPFSSRLPSTASPFPRTLPSVPFICSTSSLRCATIHTTLRGNLSRNPFTTEASSTVFPVPVGICAITAWCVKSAPSIRPLISR